MAVPHGESPSATLGPAERKSIPTSGSGVGSVSPTCLVSAGAAPEALISCRVFVGDLTDSRPTQTSQVKSTQKELSDGSKNLSFSLH